MVAQPVAPPPFIEITPEQKLRFNFHPGQWLVWQSSRRFVLILAGLQSGKTTTYPLWLYREMQTKGPGDYLVGSPTFGLLELKALPEFKRFFLKLLNLGEYKSSPIREFTLSRHGECKLWGKPQDEPTRVLFGHAQDPDSLESGTYKAAVLDEAGQKKFRRESWVSIQGRLSIHQGRCLFPTTPYTLGWLKSELYDPWVAADGNHPDIEVVNFESTMNPVFPQEEFDRMRAILPDWMFNMRYRGRFQRPAGMIYDCWDDRENVIPWFPVPGHWPRFVGLDFGGVNTAAIKVAQELDRDGGPTGRYIGYDEYLGGGLTAEGHTDALLANEPRTPTAVGGSKSEGQWRNEFAAAGLPIWEPPISDVEIGIQRLYGLSKLRRFVVMNTLRGFLDQVHGYSRPLDELGQPTEGIEDKEMYHFLDAARYVGSYLWQGLDGDVFSWAG